VHSRFRRFARRDRGGGSCVIRKGFASYETAGGAQVLVTPRDFQSVFKTQADCEALFSALKKEIWKDQAAAVETLAEGVE